MIVSNRYSIIRTINEYFIRRTRSEIVAIVAVSCWVYAGKILHTFVSMFIPDGVGGVDGRSIDIRETVRADILQSFRVVAIDGIIQTVPNKSASPAV